MARPDGTAYIDITIAQPPSPSPSGSSIEQSDDPPTSPPISPRASPVGSSASSYADVDYEDWELADGDFTKQYNRARQTQAATTSTTSRPPLPTRNNNPHTSRVVVSNKVAINDKDKSDRATQEQVLDPRTRLVLAGLTNRGVIQKLERCISTGKEANVYFSAENLAVKIYRTSILSFKSRQVYIEGEHRFRGEYSSSRNPRKMIRVWAEKELRNLRRLAQGGVKTPRVYECKENVLVMEFLGNDGIASPRLKDADMLDPAMVYAEMLVAMRRMYQVCKLVHADLSEYNVLYHDGHPYIIDVSQSVEQDHPKSLDFLRNDIRNVKQFFAQQTQVLSMKRMWDFIIDEMHLDDPSLLLLVAEWLDQPDTVDDAVFMASFIPRSLAEVFDPERDADLVAAGKGDQLVYAGLTGTNMPLAEPSEPSEDGSMSEASDSPNQPRGFRHEDRDAKKDRKKAVKEEQREKRKNKMSKGEKQRLIKKSGR